MVFDGKLLIGMPPLENCI